MEGSQIIGSGNATASPTPTSPVLVSVLEAFIPGLSLVTNFASDYFKVDVTQYLWAIMVLLAITTGVNFLSEKFHGLWSYYLVSTAEIHYNDEIYNYVMYWISKHGMSKKASHFIVGTQTNSAFVYTGEEDDDNNPYDDEEEDDEDALLDVITSQPRRLDKAKTLRYTPSQGTHYFWYKGSILCFTRTQEKETGFYGSSFTEIVYLSCFGRNPQLLKDLLQEAQRAYMERDGNKTVIYRGSKPIGGSGEDMEWVRCMSRPPRPLSTVVLDETQKQMVLDDMRQYLHPRTKKWYSNRGIPYRRGYLMEGPPGTGKSSITFALAGALQLRIYVVSLNSRSITEDSLASLFRDLPWRCIVLLEDIDSAGLAAKRADNAKAEKAEEKSDTTTDNKDAEKSDGSAPASKLDDGSTVNKALSLSGFLNIIDGVASSEGRILVMTTNHMERLDPALLRPGRVDMIVKFRNADAEMAKGIFKAIYSTFESENPYKSVANAAANGIANGSANADLKRLTAAYFHHGKSDEEIAALAEKFASILPSQRFSPAEIQNYLLRHKASPEEAVEGLQSWIDKSDEDKKAQ